MTEPVIQLTESQFRRWMRVQLDAWDSQTCADYFGVERKHFLSEYATDPHFPRPFGITKKARSGRLWDAEEVRRFRKRKSA